MTCQECELLLADGGAEASADDHLRGCAECRAFQDDLRANALALSSLRDDELLRVKTSKRRPILPRPVPWIAAAAAAVLLALSARHQEGTHLQPRQATAPGIRPVTVTAKLAPEPAHKLPVRRHKPKPARREVQPEQPLLVKMLTPDPDVVVYWLVD
jgi:hypothetical protein